MKEYKVDGHVSSYLPADREWTLVWHDEFDGDKLDTDKWFFRTHLGGARHQAYIEDAISFDGNSNIIFHLVEKDGQYYSSTIQTGENYTDRPNGESKNAPQKFMHKYGYYEVRCKLQKETPWWSAFWLQAPNVALLPDPAEAGVEVDILESFYPGTYIPHFNHWGGYGAGHKWENSAGFPGWAKDEDRIPISLDEYHTFAVDWDETGYTFYVDGKQSGKKLCGAVSHTEQFVLLFTEAQGYRVAPGYAGEPGTYPPGIKDCFIVDYVRVFDARI